MSTFAWPCVNVSTTPLQLGWLKRATTLSSNDTVRLCCVQFEVFDIAVSTRVWRPTEDCAGQRLKMPTVVLKGCASFAGKCIEENDVVFVLWCWDHCKTTEATATHDKTVKSQKLKIAVNVFVTRHRNKKKIFSCIITLTRLSVMCELGQLGRLTEYCFGWPGNNTSHKTRKKGARVVLAFVSCLRFISMNSWI